MNKHLLALLLSSVLISSAYAVKVKAIYQIDIPVASQSAEDRAQAEETAFGQVLVKVTGNSHIMENPDLKAKVKNAESFIDEFSYKTSQAIPHILSLQFNPSAINRILRNTGSAIWGQNRPSVLGWIAYEAPGRETEIIGSDSPIGIQTLLTQFADSRGLPLIIPMMDTADMGQVNVNDVVTMSSSPLELAAKRYSCDGMLIARIIKLQKGYVFHSKLTMGNDEWTWNESSETLDGIVTAMLNHLGDALAGRYATVVSNTVQSHVTLKITSVSEEGDLSHLIQYLSHLTPVADVQPMRIEGDEVVLNVSLRGSKESLIQAFTIGQKLIPTGESEGEELAYQWNP